MHDVDLILSGGAALLMDRDFSRVENAALAVSCDRIAAIGSKSDIEQNYRAPRAIHVEDGLLLPGFVNCHTHAAMTCFRGIADDMDLMDWLRNYIFPAEARNLNPHVVYWASLLACAEMIKSGTTTFCDMYIFEDETAQAASEAGMRCLLGEGLFDFPSPSCQTPAEGLAYSRRLIEKWRNHPRIGVLITPHSLYTCSHDLLIEAKALADEYGLMIGIHLLENGMELAGLDLKFDKGAVSYLEEIGYLNERLLAYHAVCLSSQDIRRFAQSGCKVSHNPASNMKLASGVAPVPEMLAAGVCVGLGTDGCASNNTLDMIREMSLASKLHKVHRLDPTVMDAKTMVHMATLGGAKTIGLEDLIGSLEVGKQADIIVIDMKKPHLTPVYNDYSHLVYAASGADVHTVVIAGRPVMENRRLLTIDESDVMSQVRKISKNIWSSLKPVT